MILDIPSTSDFSIHNLPFGIFSTAASRPRVGIAIGNHILDLAAIADMGLIDIEPVILKQPFLNDFIALGKSVTSGLRKSIQSWLQDPNSPLAKAERIFIPQAEAQMHLPIRIGDYTDFYSSIEHATNVGKMFRDPDNALLPNWKHMPVGYHGRTSSIMLSGEPVTRPKGQVLPKGSKAPIFQQSAQLDFELEIAFIVGKENSLGNPISTEEAEDHIFGLVLFNDWSARDIQRWEYVPLGPFLGKNFASSMSPWIVPLEALDPFRIEGPAQEPMVLPYLQFEGKKNYDIHLQVGISPEEGGETIICQTNFKYMYWNMVQQLAHHTVNGCNVRVGDLMASGTISGKDPGSYGSMLELSWGASQAISLNDGDSRTFIQDGDTISISGFAENKGIRVGFGNITSKVLPSL